MALVRRLVKTGDIEDKAVTVRKVGTNEIQLEIPIPLLPGRYTGLALDTVGTKVDTPTLYLLSSELLKHAKAAYFEVAHDVSGTTAGAFEARLRDVTAGVDVATISIAFGTSSKRARSANILAGLTAGNEIGAQFIVTTAAAAAEVGDFIDAKLILVLGIS